MPEISVVMACYNEEGSVDDAIYSILNQSFTDLEFIIVDDGSTDSTLQRIRAIMKTDKRINLIINNENKGLATSLNRAIAASKGTYIARMDADDMSLPNRLKTQINFLKKNSKVDILGSNAEMMKNGSISYSNVPLDHKFITKQMLSKTCIIHPTVVMKKSCFDEDGYDPRLPWAEDKDLWLRWKNKYTFANEERALIRYNVKSNINWKIFYYNHLVIWKHMSRNKSFLLDFPVFLKSIFSHLWKLALV